MTDNHAANTNAIVPVHRTPFPFARLFYAIGFSLIAWFTVHVIFFLAVMQFVVLALTGRQNEELKGINFSLVQYLWELLAYITFVRDELPFPIGQFPKHG